jgi:hypothetical protein
LFAILFILKILYVKNIGGPPSLIWNPTSILKSKNPSYSPAANMAKGDVPVRGSTGSLQGNKKT